MIIISFTFDVSGGIFQALNVSIETIVTSVVAQNLVMLKKFFCDSLATFLLFAQMMRNTYGSKFSHL